MSFSIDTFISQSRWKKELETLRAIMLDCHLTEEVKWGQPCYTFEHNNIAIIGELKDCCVIGFFKGALLKDPNNILLKPGKNTQAARSIKFRSVDEIKKLEPVLKAYIYEAVEIEEAGLKVEFKKEYDMPEEFQRQLDKDPALKKAFHALTPGRQRGYLLYFAQPKQSKTRESRIEKSTPQILAGKGLHD